MSIWSFRRAKPVRRMSVLWYVYTAARVAQGLLAIAGNSLTIACVIRFNTLRTPAHLLIAGLALNDVVHGLTIALLIPTINLVTHWPLWRLTCLSLQSLEAMTTLVEFLSFTLLSTERFVALRSKLGLNKCFWSRGFTVSLVILTWAFSYIFLSVLVITTEKLRPGFQCKMSLIFPPYYMGIGVGCFLLATVTTFILYAQIAKLAWQSQKRRVNPTAGNNQMAINRKKELNIARMLGMVVGVFFLLFSPMFFVTFTVNQNSAPWHRFLYYICILLADANFWINPVIYSWRNKDFRTSFRTLLGRRFHNPLGTGETQPSREGQSLRTKVSVITVMSKEKTERAFPSTSKDIPSTYTEDQEIQNAM